MSELDVERLVKAIDAAEDEIVLEGKADRLSALASETLAPVIARHYQASESEAGYRVDVGLPVWQEGAEERLRAAAQRLSDAIADKAASTGLGWKREMDTDAEYLAAVKALRRVLSGGSVETCVVVDCNREQWSGWSTCQKHTLSGGSVDEEAMRL